MEEGNGGKVLSASNEIIHAGKTVGIVKKRMVEECSKSGERRELQFATCERWSLTKKGRRNGGMGNGSSEVEVQGDDAMGLGGGAGLSIRSRRVRQAGKEPNRLANYVGHRLGGYKYVRYSPTLESLFVST